MRGTAAGEGVVSQANTKEFEEGYERTFGKPDGSAKGGKWVFDSELMKLVPAESYVPPSEAKDAAIMAGRFYENTSATDGTDIGSRERYNRYMREKGVTNISDYKEHFQKERAKKDRFFKEGNNTDADKKQRREDVARTVHELSKKGRR